MNVQLLLRLSFVILVLDLSLAPRSALSQTWLNAADGLWDDPNNWSAGVVPNTFGNIPVFNAVGSPYTATFTQSIDNAQIQVFQDTEVTLDLGGFTYQFSNTSTSTLNSSISVGAANASPNQPARLTIRNGAFRPYSVSIGHSRDGEMTVKSGVDWQWPGFSSNVYVGAGSGLTGTLNIESGPATTVNAVYVGSIASNTTGFLTLDRELIATAFFVIGEGVTPSTVTINNGGKLTGSNLSGSNSIRQNSTVTVKSGGEIGLIGAGSGQLSIQGTLDLEGGTVNANARYNLSGTGSIRGFGNVNGNLGFINSPGSSSAQFEASGGSLSFAGDFNHSGSTVIGSNATLDLTGSSFTPQLGTVTNLANGLLHSVDGVQIDGADVITGYGVIIGEVSGSASSSGLTIASAPSGTVDLLIPLNVSTRVARTYSIGNARLRDVTIAGGVLEAANGARFAEGDLVSGFGTLVTDVELQGGTLSASGGTLQVSGALSGSGFLIGDVTANVGISSPTTTLALINNLSVGSETVQVYSQGVAQLGPNTTLTGGTLIAPNGISIDSTDTITGSGIIEGVISGSNAPNGIQPSQPLIRATSYDVGSKDVFLLSNTFANLGPHTTISGGTVNAPNGLFLQGASLLQGNGTVNGKVAGVSGSMIVLDNDLSLGDATAANGFYSNGSVSVAGGSTLTLQDSNDAVFDSGALVALGEGTSPGMLTAANGLTLDFGGNITGFGTVDTPNNAATPLINNGNITGDDPNQQITLTGYVKGVGTLDNVLITGTDAPGFSPAAVSRGSVSYDGTLEIELGGTAPGSGYDQLNHILGAGTADLDGTLDVVLIDGFTPTAGDTFEIITATSILGTFATETLPTLAGGLEWFVNYSSTSVELIATFAGDFDFNGNVAGIDFLKWQRGESPNPLSQSDLAKWEANYGNAAAQAAASTTVPEPSAGLMMAVCCGICAMRRRRATA